MTFQPGPEYGESLQTMEQWNNGVARRADGIVWCWGWDGAGDLDGPDVDPIWEHMQDMSYSKATIEVKHDRSLQI